jgi:hypothetical protein
METPEKNDHKTTAKEIKEISEKHINSVPGGEEVPDPPASGGKQFVKDDKDENSVQPEKKSSDLNP